MLLTDLVLNINAMLIRTHDPGGTSFDSKEVPPDPLQKTVPGQTWFFGRGFGSPPRFVADASKRVSPKYCGYEPDAIKLYRKEKQ